MSFVFFCFLIRSPYPVLYHGPDPARGPGPIPGPNLVPDLGPGPGPVIFLVPALVPVLFHHISGPSLRTGSGPGKKMVVPSHSGSQ